MITEIFEGNWDGKIRISDIPEIILILIVLPFAWLFQKFEDFLDICILDVKNINKNATSHNTDYDSEKDKPSLHPKGEVCPFHPFRLLYDDGFCQDCGRIIKDNEKDKLSHNQ
jgi:hypothetical protein